MQPARSGQRRRERGAFPCIPPPAPDLLPRPATLLSPSQLVEAFAIADRYASAFPFGSGFRERCLRSEWVRIIGLTVPRGRPGTVSCLEVLGCLCLTSGKQLYAYFGDNGTPPRTPGTSLRCVGLWVFCMSWRADFGFRVSVLVRVWTCVRVLGLLAVLVLVFVSARVLLCVSRVMRCLWLRYFVRS